MKRDMWSYPEELGRLDVSGFDVEARDGSIGKVDEVTYDAGESYVVVDTGVWIFGKKVLLPAGVIDRVDRNDEIVYVDRTKDEIEQAPEFDKDNYRTADYRSAVGGYYGSRDAGSDRDAEEKRVADRS